VNVNKTGSGFFAAQVSLLAVRESSQ